MPARRRVTDTPPQRGPTPDSLRRFQAKRNFLITPEPASGGDPATDDRQFVVQKHWASRLHYDFRLELGDAMKSWAIPKGPSLDPRDKRMAVHVEDHPLAYGSFEGVIPAKQYGAGKVIIWDKGTWYPVHDPEDGYRAGKLKFDLRGHKLKGRWNLVRMDSRQEKQDAWLLMKDRDEYARPAGDFSVVDELPDSVSRLPAPGPDIKASPANPRGPARDSAAIPAKAVKAPLPATLKPQLATLVEQPPATPGRWIFEIKFDGYRILARIAAGKVRLFTRNGHDWTARLPHLAKALAGMGLKPGWLDGEIVMAGAGGNASFQALQNAFDTSSTGDIVYYLFDLPYYDGYDFTRVALVDRRNYLRSVVRAPPAGIHFSEEFEADPQDLLTSACKLGLEGVIGKRAASGYSGRRSADWIKLKCSHRQEFVIGGWTDPQGSRIGLGALLLGVHGDDGTLRYAGKVGTGFDDATLRSIHKQLKVLSTGNAPFAVPPSGQRGAHWVKPRLLAEVSFAEWTTGGHIRHPVFHALRTDKPAKAIVREEPEVALGPDVEEQHSTLPSRLRVSHPDRVIDSTTAITKIDLVRYYGLVGPLMMEHLAGRPVSLLRMPQGVQHKGFFQKHMDQELEGVKKLDPALDPDHQALLEIANPMGLLSAAQMNVIEFHTWNAVKSAIATPDRMTFDLDPGEGVEWPAMQQAAKVLQAFLGELGLVPFLKTSGGKGLHVVTPIRRQHDWDTVKDFSRTIVGHLAATFPALFVAKSGPRNRVGRIFIDYLRNGFGATTVCAWSARARPGLGISVPVDWAELPRLTGGAHWTLRDVHRRLDKGNGPWSAYGKSARAVGRPMKLIGFKGPAAEAGRRAPRRAPRKAP